MATATHSHSTELTHSIRLTHFIRFALASLKMHLGFSLGFSWWLSSAQLTRRGRIPGDLTCIMARLRAWGRWASRNRSRASFRSCSLLVRLPRWFWGLTTSSSVLPGRGSSTKKIKGEQGNKNKGWRGCGQMANYLSMLWCVIDQSEPCRSVMSKPQS